MTLCKVLLVDTGGKTITVVCRVLVVMAIRQGMCGQWWLCYEGVYVRHVVSPSSYPLCVSMCNVLLR